MPCKQQRHNLGTGRAGPRELSSAANERRAGWRPHCHLVPGVGTCTARNPRARVSDFESPSLTQGVRKLAQCQGWRRDELQARLSYSNIRISPKHVIQLMQITRRTSRKGKLAHTISGQRFMHWLASKISFILVLRSQVPVPSGLRL